MLALLLVLFGLVLDETSSALVFEISMVTDASRDIDMIYDLPDHSDIHWKAGCVLIARRTRTRKEGRTIDTVSLLPLSLDRSAELRAIPHTVTLLGDHKETTQSLALNTRAVVANLMFKHGLHSEDLETEFVVFDNLNVGQYGWSADVMKFDVK